MEEHTKALLHMVLVEQEEAIVVWQVHHLIHLTPVREQHKQVLEQATIRAHLEKVAVTLHQMDVPEVEVAFMEEMRRNILVEVQEAQAI